MATYGKKKRNLLSNFSPFRDERVKYGLSSKPPSHKISKGLKINTTIPKDTARHPSKPDDSIDDLADALLDDTVHDAPSVSTQSPTTPSGFPTSTSSTLSSDKLNKPLPLAPLNEQGRGKPGTPKQFTSTYRLIPKIEDMEQRSKEESSERKLQISNPILQSLHSTDSRAETDTPKGSTDDVENSQDEKQTSAFATAADAANLSKKLLTLMRQATEKALPPLPNSKSTTSTHRSKHPRLQRSKEVFIRAKQAIADRLSSSGEKRLGSRRRRTKDVPSSSPDVIAGPEYQTDADVRRHRLDRRIAEGTNLSNSKVKSLTGDGNVRRKPLPVYESMRSPQHQPSSSDDPFSDEKSPNIDVLSPDFDDFDFDVEITGHKPANPRRTSAFEPLLSNTQLEKPGPPHQFSERISGLAQHTDTTFFSSSPEGYSTPRYRLEPQFDAKGKKRLSTVLASSPSLLDFSLDGQRGAGKPKVPEISELPKVDKARSTISLKRKTAKLDLRIDDTSPALKKVKTQDVTLTDELAKLRADNHGPLTAKDSNKRMSKSRIPGAKAKGLKIFEVGKGKAPMPRVMDNMNKRRGSMSERRSSIPGPVKRALGHERRASTPVRTYSVAEDEMSIDELQLG
ncbi:hypothetical protein MMC30_003274 [Trapelia coarctata]|nr:hypothetical protein [Trapelia coarctata]